MGFRVVKAIASGYLAGLLLLSFVAVVGGLNNANAQEVDSSEIGAASGSFRFIVWSDGSNSDIFFKRSPDNGATWQAAKNLSANPRLGGSPEVAVSGSNVFVIWIERDSDSKLNDIIFRRSIDNGGTWKPAVKISSIGAISSAFPHQLLATGNFVYVSWEQDNGEVYFRRSVDNGATWKSIFNLSSNPGESRIGQIAASGSNVYVAWNQWNAQTTQSDIIFRRSTDNGATWKSKVNLSNNGNAGGPEIAVSGAYVHIVWVQPDEAAGINDLQVFVRSSADRGATWKAAQDLTKEEVAYDFSSPLIAASGANVYVLYEEVKEGCCDVVTDIFFRVSHDNGGTWEPVVTIATRVIQNEGSSPQLLAAGSNVYAIWVVADYGAFGDLFVRKSTDNGDTWGPASADLNNKTRGPRELKAAASGSSIYMVWSNIFPKEVYFLRSLDSGSTWKPVQNISNNNGPSTSPAFGM